MLHLSVILNCQYPELKLSCSKQNKGGAMFARNVNVILICTSASRGSIFEFNYFDSSVIYASKKCQEKGWVLELRTRSEHQDWMDVLPFWIQTHFHMSYVIYNVQLSRWAMWWQASGKTLGIYFTASLSEVLRSWNSRQLLHISGTCPGDNSAYNWYLRLFTCAPVH